MDITFAGGPMDGVEMKRPLRKVGATIELLGWQTLSALFRGYRFHLDGRAVWVG